MSFEKCDVERLQVDRVDIRGDRADVDAAEEALRKEGYAIIYRGGAPGTQEWPITWDRWRITAERSLITPGPAHSPDASGSPPGGPPDRTVPGPA